MTRHAERRVACYAASLSSPVTAMAACRAGARSGRPGAGAGAAATPTKGRSCSSATAATSATATRRRDRARPVRGSARVRCRSPRSAATSGSRRARCRRTPRRSCRTPTSRTSTRSCSRDPRRERWTRYRCLQSEKWKSGEVESKLKVEADLQVGLALGHPPHDRNDTRYRFRNRGLPPRGATPFRRRGVGAIGRRDLRPN